MKKARVLSLLLLLTLMLASCNSEIAITVPGFGESGSKDENSNNDNNTSQAPDGSDNTTNDDVSTNPPSGNENNDPQKPAGPYVNDDITFDVGETVYVVVSSLDVDVHSIDTILGLALGKSGLKMTDNYPEKPNELTVGMCNRETSIQAYEYLERQDRAHDLVARYGYFCSGNTVSIVYDTIPGYEKYIASLAVKMFEEANIKHDTAINIRSGVFRASSIDLKEYQAALDSETVNNAWRRFEEIAGAEATAALKKMYSELYSDALVEWFANLFDPVTGGFYYSNGARDNEKVEYPKNSGKYYLLLPDLETTSQATGFISSSGMINDFGTLTEALPDWMRTAIIKFIKERQDPNGYFYHPQWTHEMVDSSLARRARDMTKSVGTLSQLGAKPTYNTPSGTIGDGLLWDKTPVSAAALPMPVNTSTVAAVSKVVATTVAVPAHLKDKEAFEKYLAGLDINGNSYWVGNQLASQSSEIKTRDKALKKDGADYSLVEILVNWLDDHCYETTGHWKKVADFDGLNGLMKISALYESLEAPLPYPEASVRSAIATITDEYTTESPTVCWIYNSWFTICNVIGNVKDHMPLTDSNRIISDIRTELHENAPALIKATAAKQKLFLCEDGSFSYTEASSSYTSQGLPVTLPGLKEGDVNATVICTTGTIGNMLNAFGYPNVPILTRSDFNRYIEIIEDNKEKIEASYNYTDTADEIKDGVINYKLSTHTNTSTGVTAPVIKIYNSYNITSEYQQRMILYYIINTEEGRKAGLTEKDIDYYIKEWKAHNKMYENPSVVATLMGMTTEEVKERAKHVDLNTNDERRSIYESLS